MPSKRTALVWLLRIVGGSMLFAIPFIFVPTAWMASIHEWLGLGTLPEAAITEYLTRSLSMFYGAAGALLVFVSFDVVRYRSLLLFLAAASLVAGPLMIWIDLKAGMPPSWTWSEGPFMLPLGVLLVWLTLGIGDGEHPAQGG